HDRYDYQRFYDVQSLDDIRLRSDIQFFFVDVLDDFQFFYVDVFDGFQFFCSNVLDDLHDELYVIFGISEHYFENKHFNNIDLDVYLDVSFKFTFRICI
ncbi:hypothetical protein LTR28_002079, partial [Elasticomyces elasticus]